MLSMPPPNDHSCTAASPHFGPVIWRDGEAKKVSAHIAYWVILTFEVPPQYF